ncbi:PREDICTED: uncharacterized protein LOC105964816 [Erythranthe guttata]|uniref:uncharacterized protein LOC105964816 n=1 Tax=Erythranthe guttata TaxID=4155 RepID=UPI00064DC9D2|nr:PREDICTED: uncharacterized protein LOC105964816 [Erythranthe guttata]|eukprot:XP_012844773.1 PREDICTED: uncharacterized protein LOC105964816 [Erythranthe guttata]
MKQHLSGVKETVSACQKVSLEVQLEIKDLMDAHAQKIKAKKAMAEDLDAYEEDEILEIPSQTEVSNGKRKASYAIDSFCKKGVSLSSQSSIKACMQSKDKWKDTDLAIALWFYDACIPFNACTSPYFQGAINKIASMGHGYTHPSYHALRVNLLNDAKTHVTLMIDSIRDTWADTGCTIMGDDWIDIRQRFLINFLVYCPKGISFIKYVDASDICTNADTLCNLCDDIVEWVGPRNVVHMVTDNGANYKAAGSRLMEKYQFIFWSPCAAHCVNLIFKDVGDMPTVQSLAVLASKVTVFVYNHKFALNWLRNRKRWREIIRPGTTRFATTFIALQSLYAHNDDLQALVVSPDYKQYLKMQKGREVKQIVLDEIFWNNCLVIVRVMTPLIRLLRLSDTDEKPSMAYYLNPAFQYDKSAFCTEPEIMGGVLNIMFFIIFFKIDEWWRLFGFDAPNLQKLAIKILSQTASSSGCERNSNVFERIHTKKRNILEHNRLNDLVYDHYNLRLKNRLVVSKRSYDPVDYESIEKTEFWIVENEEEGELDYDELENMVQEEYPKDGVRESSTQEHEFDVMTSHGGDEGGDEDEIGDEYEEE